MSNLKLPGKGRGQHAFLAKYRNHRWWLKIIGHNYSNQTARDVGEHLFTDLQIAKDWLVFNLRKEIHTLELAIEEVEKTTEQELINEYIEG